MTNRLVELNAAGTAVWLDFLDRRFLEEGGLDRLIREDGISGVTSNPSIFEQAMGSGDAYDADFAASIKAGASDATTLYEAAAIADIQTAADCLAPVYERTGGRDGFVSLEVSPDLAFDTAATIAEARRLWQAVNRPNLMIKVPGTAEGVPATRQLLEDGININITLLFSRAAYEAVAIAHVDALEARLAKGLAIDKVASVASFFISRIDTAIDKMIDDRISGGDKDSDALKAIRGKVAIANAVLAYSWWQDLVAGARWQALAAKGAAPQRLLWASTGVKDKAYPPTLYADELIGPETVNTLPVATIDAFRTSGTVRQSLTADVAGARQVLDNAQRLGLNLDQVTDALVRDGVDKFIKAFSTLLGVVEKKRQSLSAR